MPNNFERPLNREELDKLASRVKSDAKLIDEGAQYVPDKQGGARLVLGKEKKMGEMPSLTRPELRLVMTYAMHKQNITQKAIATGIGVTSQSVWNWYEGNFDPSPENLEKMMTFLGLSATDVSNILAEYGNILTERGGTLGGRSV